MFLADYDDQSSHTSVIREHYVFLLETLDVKFSGLVDHLYSKEVLSAVERDDITAVKTSFRANEKLLSALSRKSPKQFQVFLDALDNCGQQYIPYAISLRGLWLLLRPTSSQLKNRNTYRLEHVTLQEKSESEPAKNPVGTLPEKCGEIHSPSLLASSLPSSPPLPPLSFSSLPHAFTVVPSSPMLHEVLSAITAIPELLVYLTVRQLGLRILAKFTKLHHIGCTLVFVGDAL